MNRHSRTALRALLAMPVTRRGTSAALVAWEVATILRSGAFDRDWYEGQAGHRRGPAAAVRHYVSTGRGQGLSPHPFFEPGWWELTAGPSPVPLDPLTRFLLGDRSGTGSPHPLLDLGAWAAAHPEAQHHRHGAWGHALATSSASTPLPALPLEPGVAGPSTPRDDLERALSAASAPLPGPGTTSTGGGAGPSGSTPEPRGEGVPAVGVVVQLRDWRECLVSLAALRSLRSASWEVVVVAGEGPDGTPAAGTDAVARVAAGDPRVRVAREASLAEVVEGCPSPVLALLREGSGPPAAGWEDAVRLLLAGGAEGVWSGADPRAGDPVGRAEVLLARRAVVAAAAASWDATDRSYRLRVAAADDAAWHVAGTGRLVRLPGGASRQHTAPAADAQDLLVGEALRARHVHGALSPAWAPPGGPTVPALSLLVAADDDWVRARECVSRLLAASRSSPVEVVVADASTRPASRRMLRALALQDARVRHLRVPPASGRSVAWASALRVCSGDLVALVDPRVTLAPEAMDLLVRHLDDTGVAAAAPVLIGPDATIASAGTAVPPPGGLPIPLLLGLPVEDARRAGPLVRVAATDGGVLVCRAADLRSVGGPDPLVGPWGEVDLGLRMTAHGRGAVVVDALAEAWTDEPVGWCSGPPDELEAGGREVLRRHRDPAGPSTDDVLGPAGLVVVGYRAEVVPGASSEVVPGHPVVGRPAVRITPAGPRLRWSVKIAAPAGEVARRWGDLHFARALARSLERLGQEVVVDHGPAVGRDTAYLDDVSLVLRGRDRVPRQPGALNLLWVISHPELVDDTEIAAADAVFAASTSWAEEASARSASPVTPLLQATDASRFNPGVPPGPSDDVLFVGNSRGVYRSVVRHLVEAGVDVAVYGGRWESFLPPGVLRAVHVPNDELPGRYAGAGVVLNDHWEGMRSAGFMSNRLFDAAATGTRVVSDHVEGAEEVLAGLVRCYRTPEELVHLVRDSDQEFPSDDARRRLAERVATEHSFDARAQVLVERAAQLWQRRGAPGAGAPSERVAEV